MEREIYPGRPELPRRRDLYGGNETLEGRCRLTKPLSFALVGAGGIAQSYAAAFDNCPDAELVAVADVRLDAAEAMAKKVNGKAFSSTEELLLATPDLDAAIICTPPNSHE